MTVRCVCLPPQRCVNFAENSQGVILLTLIIESGDCSCICGVANILDKLLGSKITVVVSRGIIRVTVTIGDCQACVSFSSEGCLIQRKQLRWNLINLDYSIERL